MGEFNQYTKPWIKKESAKEKETRALKIFSILNKTYPYSKTALTYKTPMQMLAAVILSAQATDKKVNEVTGAHLFKKYKTPQDFAKANLKTFEKEISTIGLYRSKAKAIIASARIIVDEFKGKVPNTMEGMLKLRGVARKTANIVLWNVHGIISGIAVDTHVRRVSQRLGFTEENDPVKIEKALTALYKDKKKWPKINTLLIDHGRAICKAPTPLCAKCPLNKICPSARV